MQRRCEGLAHLENYKKLGVGMVERMLRDDGKARSAEKLGSFNITVLTVVCLFLNLFLII